MLKQEIKLVCELDTDLFKCVSEDIVSKKVIITNKQLQRMAEHHPEAYKDVLIELKSIIANPDYILKDRKNDNTAILIKRLAATSHFDNHLVILRLHTISEKDDYYNSIISGWVISDKRLQNYLRTYKILYKKTNI